MEYIRRKWRNAVHHVEKKVQFFRTRQIEKKPKNDRHCGGSPKGSSGAL